MAKGKGITKNKKKSKKNNKSKIKTCLKLSVIGVCILLMISIVTISLLYNTDKVVITIDGIKYTETDFYMYLYLAKCEYFNDCDIELDSDTLNTLVDNDGDTTIGEYLKDKVINKIKVSASILNMASVYNITLTQDDVEEIESEKEEFISSLGGQSYFASLLKENHTNEDAYDEVAYTEKIYEKLYDELYSEGKEFDLTDDEVTSAYEYYLNNYVKIKQIIILKKDLETNETYDEIVLNQKYALANYLKSELTSENITFEEAVLLYSEDYNEEVVSEYYELSSLLEEIQNVVNTLEVGDISDVVSTDNAYHIILKEELDDQEFNTYLDTLREEKLITEISSYLDKISIIKSTYIDDIAVK